MRGFFTHVEAPVVLDTAGKYGAGLALEVIGKGLRELGIPPEDVVVSNKLGWKRVPLTTPEPTFEPGAWAELENDAVQCISYDGILECYEQGCELLGEGYTTQVVSVHDPDEYLAAATSEADRDRRFQDVLGAYKALFELKAAGHVQAVGVGSKDWRVIQELAGEVDLDWVMLACSLTVYTHPAELLAFMDELNGRGVGMINSAVFNAGFLVGGRYFDYRQPDPAKERELFTWRDCFLGLCAKYHVSPAEVCVRFGMTVPGVVATALNTSKPERVAANVAAVQAEIPAEFWAAARYADLIQPYFPFV
jgi:D-threo-aldose 1-dehydrogenase